MPSPDWQSLVVSVNERVAIYAEHFPGSLRAAGDDVVAWFTDDQARKALFTYAGAWRTLAHDADEPTVRYLYVSDGTTTCRFRGVELAPNAIVVDKLIRL